MNPDKRKHPRFAKLLEARSLGSSGGSDCRIADISWGGCFVQTPTAPTVGEHTVIVTNIGGHEVALGGSVVHREIGIGFSMKFDQLSPEQIAILQELLGPAPDAG